MGWGVNRFTFLSRFVLLMLGRYRAVERGYNANRFGLMQLISDTVQCLIAMNPVEKQGVTTVILLIVGNSDAGQELPPREPCSTDLCRRIHLHLAESHAQANQSTLIKPLIATLKCIGPKHQV